MITPVVQRWRERRGSYRPAGEPVDPRAYEVAPIDEKPAEAFVLAHHYSASYPAARFRFGLFARGGELAGVAVFSHPVQERVLDCLPGDGLERTELGRFVLLDGVRANAESWMIARCFELLRRAGIVSVVSFSDPEPRACASGEVVFPGHIGGIYQASNATFMGRATPSTLRLLPDGRTLNNRRSAALEDRAGPHVR